VRNRLSSKASTARASGKVISWILAKKLFARIFKEPARDVVDFNNRLDAAVTAKLVDKYGVIDAIEE
jgi:hypothetical protein